jgi:hypothetical protein
MQSFFLTPIQLAARWNMASTTLSQWRWSGCGPKFHKIGRRVSYQLQDIEQFESSRCWQSTSQYNCKTAILSDQSRLDKNPQLKCIPLLKKGG